MSDYTFRKLADLCTINLGTNFNLSNIAPGDYPVITDEQKAVGFHHEFNAPENTITIVRSSTIIATQINDEFTVATKNDLGFVNRHESKSFVTGNCFYLSDIHDVDPDYLFYYLRKIQHKLKKMGQIIETIPRITEQNLADFKILVPSSYKQKSWIEKITEQQAECKVIDGMVSSVERGLEEFLHSGLTDIFLKRGIKEFITKPIKDLCKISHTDKDELAGIPIGTIRIKQDKKEDTVDLFQFRGLMMYDNSVYLSDYQECIHPIYLYQRLEINANRLRAIDTSDKIKRDYIANFEIIVPPMEIQEEWWEGVCKRQSELQVLRDRLQKKAYEHLEYLKDRGLNDIVKESVAYHKQIEDQLKRVMEEIA
jgi:restriction endonuclease S subunit